MTDKPLFDDGLRVLNLGLELFADNLREEGAEVIQIDWRPPANGDLRLIRLLSLMQDEEE